MTEQTATQELRFNEEDHTYWVGEKQLTSVTTLIKSLSREFDRDRISQQCAKKHGKTQEEILAEWDRKSAVALEKGTRVHAYAEDVMAGISDGVLDLVNEKLPEMAAFDAAWASLRTKLDAQVVAREQVVFSTTLGVAGRLDAVLSLALPGKKNRVPCVFDWKTGKFTDSNQYQRLLPPFNDLHDCQLNVYSLQTSLYRLLLEEAGTETFGHCYLVHLSEFGTYHVYRATDYRERLKDWLLAGE